MCVVRSSDIARVLAILGAGGRETHIAAVGSNLIIFAPDGFGGMSMDDMAEVLSLGWTWDSLIEFDGGSGAWKFCQCLGDL